MMAKKETPETGLKNAVLQYLQLRNVYAWRNNSGMLKNQWGVPVFYGKPGSSDILGVMPDGRFLAIELKTKPATTIKGRPTEQQEEFLAEINARGGLAFVARSIDDVEREIG